MATTYINFKNTEVDDAARNYFTEMIGKLDNFLHEENVVHGELELESAHRTGPFHRAEISIMPNSEIYAEAHGNDFFEAIDLLMPKIKEQLSRHKDKIISERRHDGAAIKDLESETLNP